jgi:hypothetical protein
MPTTKRSKRNTKKNPWSMTNPKRSKRNTQKNPWATVDSVYAYQTSFGLASRQILRRSQGTLLPSSVNPRYRIRGTNV